MSAGELATEIQDRLNAGSGSANQIVIKDVVYQIGKVSATLLGFIVLIIIIAVPIVVALELIYLSFPTMSERVDDIMNKLDNKRGRVYGFAFHDARLALKRANTEQTGKSAYSIYLVIKIKSIFCAVFVIAMILGMTTPVIELAFNMVSGLFDVISKGFG